MDIRRLPLWEGRNATYMANDYITAVIEDQGSVMLELSSQSVGGARINALSMPYFRGFSSGVLSDENASWYQNKQTLYQAGGSYFTFPYPSEDIITSNNTYWTVRKYGTEEEYGGVWLLSEMKSRMESCHYRLERLDFLLPSHPAVYSAIKATNLSPDQALETSPSFNSMLSAPFLETGCVIDSNARSFSAYQKARRELARNRYMASRIFDDLKHAPLASGGVCDASYLPPPTGTYDYIIGKTNESQDVSYLLMMNPRTQQMFINFAPSSCFPNVAITQNYLGRFDSPWALWDGGVSQVYSLSLGFNWGPKGTRNLTIPPHDSFIFYFASAYCPYDNPRMGLGYSVKEVQDDGFFFKRTKSSLFVPCDTRFRIMKKLSSIVFGS